jgi:hypothetical protein
MQMAKPPSAEPLHYRLAAGRCPSDQRMAVLSGQRSRTRGFTENSSRWDSTPFLCQSALADGEWEKKLVPALTIGGAHIADL